MARQRKIYDDDDGRTIADMSGVTRRSLWTPRAPAGSEKLPKAKPESTETDADAAEKPTVSREQLKYMILGGLAASLLIVAVFGAVFALVILIIGRFGSCA